MDIIPATYSKSFTKQTNFYNSLLIVYAYSNIQTLYEMENITTEEVMDKPDMFQKRCLKVDEFVLWDIDRIQTDSGTQVTPKELQEGLYVRVVQLAIASTDHQVINGQV